MKGWGEPEPRWGSLRFSDTVAYCIAQESIAYGYKLLTVVLKLEAVLLHKRRRQKMRKFGARAASSASGAASNSAGSGFPAPMVAALQELYLSGTGPKGKGGGQSRAVVAVTGGGGGLVAVRHFDICCGLTLYTTPHPPRDRRLPDAHSRMLSLMLAPAIRCHA